MKKQRLEMEKDIEEGWIENDKVKMEEYDQRMQQRAEEVHHRK